MSGVHIFWIVSRGAGIAAILVSGLAVAFGLMSGRGMPFARLRKKVELRPMHEALSLATIVLVLAHGLVLLGDPWLHPGAAGIAVPFVMSYRTFWTGLGIIAGYGLVLLGLSYYARKWIGPDRWRIAHRFTALFWVLGLIHTFGAGSDATQPWVLIPVIVTSTPAVILLGIRLFGGAIRPPAASARDRDRAEGTRAVGSSRRGAVPGGQ